MSPILRILPLLAICHLPLAIARAQLPALPPLPPAPSLTNSHTIQIGTNLYRQWTPPRSQPARTNVVLTWDPYTNLFVTVQASTNLTDWYWKTNVPIWQTSVTIPVNQQFECYRIFCDYHP